MTRKLPYLALYVGDWLSDEALTLCSPAARGVWIDFLCMMHKRDRCGVLIGSREQLSQIGRCPAVHLDRVLSELQTTGAADISERDGVVTVVNRRMKREAKDRTDNKLRQQRYRESESSNGELTPLSHLYDIDNEDEFFSQFPKDVQSPEFRRILNDWLRYKNGRGEKYEPIGLKKMLSLAGKRAAEFGISGVIEAMERAMASTWAGWDFFDRKESNASTNRRSSTHVGPGQRYVPPASS